MKLEELQELAAGIKSRQDLAAFVIELSRSYEEIGDFWENDRLDIFLEALGGWTEDMDGYFKNRGEACPENPSWNLFAQMLLAAMIYE